MITSSAIEPIAAPTLEAILLTDPVEAKHAPGILITSTVVGHGYADGMTAVRPAMLIAALLTLASLIGTAGAQAAVRYASPDGAGAICSEAAPCSVVTAIEFAANGDEIVIGDGEYTLSSSLNAARSNLDIHATLGSRPSLTSGPRLKFSAGGLTIFGAGTNVRGLALISPLGGTTAPVRIYGAGSIVTRVMAVGLNHPGCEVGAANVRLTYVMCFSFLDSGIEVVSRDGTSTVRIQNALAISQASGADHAGIRIATSGTARLDVTIINTVARASAAERDIVTHAFDTSRSTVSVSSSNFRARTEAPRTSITAPTAAAFNQTADPRLGWNPDFSLRPQADSPLIDRGSVLAVGATGTDLGGGAAPRGGARDIGAYEYDGGLPPVPPNSTMAPPAGSGLPTPAPVATAPSAPTDVTAGASAQQNGAFTVTRARLNVLARAIRVRTSATVSAAGLITQRVTIGTRAKRRVLCSSRVTVDAAGKVPITCTMRRAARDLLRKATQRYTVTTVFVAGADRVTRTQRVVVSRRR